MIQFLTIVKFSSEANSFSKNSEACRINHSMKISRNDYNHVNITSKYFIGISMTRFAKYVAQEFLKYSSGLNSFTRNHFFLKAPA